MGSSFGDFITKERVNQRQTLRKFFLKLKSLGFKKDITQYSKIERGVQNPHTKDEFLLILEALGLKNEEVIKKWESKAMKFIPKKEKNKLEYLPAFLPSSIDSEEKLDSLLDTISQVDEPDFSEDSE